LGRDYNWSSIGLFCTAKVEEVIFSEIVKSMDFAEVLPEMRTRSEVVVLDFAALDLVEIGNVPKYKNISYFFEECRQQGINPREPTQRQRFNNRFLEESGKRYLIGRYLEDRTTMLPPAQVTQGRVFHEGIDLFCRDLEPVYAPCDGEVVQAGQEPGEHSYGFYVILRHKIRNKELNNEEIKNPYLKNEEWFSLYGHLASQIPGVGKFISKGEEIARLGTIKENGGWSHHLHFQLALEIEDGPPYGYCTADEIEEVKKKYPDPRMVLGKLY